MKANQGNQANELDLNQIAKIAKDTVLHGQSVERRLGLTEMNITQLLKDVGSHDTQLGEISTKVENLELNYEITDEQSKTLQTRIKSRVREFCEYPSVYYQTFIQDCYSFLKKNHHCGSKLATTKKRNYDYVMDGITAWHPDGEKLRTRKDQRDAEARKHEVKITKMAK